MKNYYDDEEVNCEETSSTEIKKIFNIFAMNQKEKLIL